MGRESFDFEKTAMELVMNDNVTKKRQLAKKIFDAAYEEGVYPSSIHDFYMARGRGEFSGNLSLNAGSSRVTASRGFL